MVLEQRFRYFQPDKFNLNGAGILGTSPGWQFDRTWPVEYIAVHVGFTVTTPLVWAPSTAQTPDAYDNILQLLAKAELIINDGKNPRTIVSVSGIGLLEHAFHSGENIDAATLELVGWSQTAGLANGCYQITYQIPMVSKQIGEPLRTRMYLPVHKMQQDPQLKLTFNTLAAMGITSGVIGNVYVDVEMINRIPTAQSEAKLISTAPLDQLDSKGNILPTTTGYVPFDLIETAYGVGTGVTTEQKFSIATPGEYVTMCFRQYLGGANISRNVLDVEGIGDTVAHGFGNEGRWRLETGAVTIREWRWKHLRALNDCSNPQFNNPVNLFAAATSAGSPTTAFNLAPNFSGARLSGTNFRAASSTFLSFLNSGLDLDTGVELGSLLDCNTPANNGLKMELIGKPANTATNGSSLFVVGHRLFGDLSRWTTFNGS